MRDYVLMADLDGTVYHGLKGGAKTGPYEWGEKRNTDAHTAWDGFPEYQVMITIFSSSRNPLQFLKINAFLKAEISFSRNEKIDVNYSYEVRSTEYGVEFMTRDWIGQFLVPDVGIGSHQNKM